MLKLLRSNSVQDISKLKDSTLYVNLEPCSHFGKTPPCADLIISYSIPRVVVGTPDTSEKVSGRGLTRLQEAGCEVISGVLGEECRRLNRRFFTFHEKKRPYITLKWAQSADGFIDIKRTKDPVNRPTWITGKPERVLVHRWRAEEESILVGAGTVRADDPLLNVRDWKGKDPLRIVLSASGFFGNGGSLFEDAKGTVLFTENTGAGYPGSVTVSLDERLPACSQIVRYLYDRGIQSLLIEGGAKVLGHFIDNGLWDEARIFSGPQYFKEGVASPSLKGRLFSKSVFTSSSLEVYLNTDDNPIPAKSSLY